MDEGMALAQGAVERLSEDEALRGDLTDEGAKAVLDWATNALIAAAGEIAKEPDEQARGARMDAAEEAVRRVAKLLVRAAERHQRGDVMALVNDPLVVGSFAVRLRLGALGLRLGDDSDRNAIRLAGALRGVRP
jgi:hypothetical protein